MKKVYSYCFLCDNYASTLNTHYGRHHTKIPKTVYFKNIFAKDSSFLKSKQLKLVELEKKFLTQKTKAKKVNVLEPTKESKVDSSIAPNQRINTTLEVKEVEDDASSVEVQDETNTEVEALSAEVKATSSEVEATSAEAVATSLEAVATSAEPAEVEATSAKAVAISAEPAEVEAASA